MQKKVKITIYIPRKLFDRIVKAHSRDPDLSLSQVICRYTRKGLSDTPKISQ